MIAAPATLAVEWLHFPDESPRTSALSVALRAAAKGAEVRLEDRTSYGGGADWLMIWGPGAPNRFEAMRRQVEAGGHVIAWDAAYWSRDVKFRCAIDAAHPQAWVMRADVDGARLAVDGPVVRDAWNPQGPVILAGLGPKARVQYGADVVDAWEAAQARAARASGRTVLYRPKRAGEPAPSWAPRTSSLPIERVLEGASAVITWHSNVGVDAIRLGIPVICRDGAAAAICGHDWPNQGPTPLPASWRQRFLERLAWFQWAPREAPDCWRFLRRLLA